MTERPRIRVVIALVAIALPGSFSWAQSARAKRQELREVQKQLEQKKREADEYQRETQTLKRDLSSLATETSESRRKLVGLEAKMREVESVKSDLKARLAALQLAENQWQGVLTDEMNAYFNRHFDEWEYYGQKDLWMDSFRRAAILEKVSYVEGLQGFKEKTEVAQAEITRQKSQLQSRSNRVRAEHLSRQSLYRQKKEVYLENKQKVAEALRQIQELKDSAVSLTHLLRALERKSPYRAKGAPVPLAEAPHSLPWPVEGQIISYFGKQQLPEIQSWIVNQGVRFATSDGALVRPVKAGKVIFSGPFRSYGQVVIVDHGLEFYTVYGMLGEIRKNKGESVVPVDALGVAGRGTQGGLVYFEIRQSGDALDPVAWLRKN